MYRRCRGDNLVQRTRLGFRLLLRHLFLGERRGLGGGLLLRSLVRGATRLEATCIRIFSLDEKAAEEGKGWIPVEPH